MICSRRGSFYSNKKSRIFILKAILRLLLVLITSTFKDTHKNKSGGLDQVNGGDHTRFSSGKCGTIQGLEQVNGGTMQCSDQVNGGPYKVQMRLMGGGQTRYRSEYPVNCILRLNIPHEIGLARRQRTILVI